MRIREAMSTNSDGRIKSAPHNWPGPRHDSMQSVHRC